MPTEAELGGLAELGIQVQVMRHLPLALVQGSLSQLETAVDAGIATDIYPNERLRYFSDTSTRSIGAQSVRLEGVTGRGVGVAIVDTGIDATHPDLADHVTHNVKIIGPEYAEQPSGSTPGNIVVAVDQGPYNNTDLTSGHGTHVAGIVAADAHSSHEQIGVAPDANLIGYAVGDVASVVTTLAAFQDILEHRHAWGIKVVNNSWGISYRLFDPADPVNLASKALHDAGIVVVFAAGNEAEEMQLNPYSAAPWVISVGSGTVDKRHSDFSSDGIAFDNSRLSSLPADGHLRFDGDGIGLYHPDVSAPGTEIVSSGTRTGLYTRAVAPCLGAGSPLPACTATTSGTSMAAPHVAGVAALLLQVRPDLSPEQVRQVIQVTATPMSDGTPFYRGGYGFVDAAAAVALVRRPDFGSELLAGLERSADARVQGQRSFAGLERSADARVQGQRSFAVRSTDFWTSYAAPASVGVLDRRTYEIAVTPETAAVRAVLAFPYYTGIAGLNAFEYKLTLKDARGTVVAVSETSTRAGMAALSADLETGRRPVSFGKWTLTVEGLLGISGGEALHDVVTLTLAQLVPQSTG